MKRINRLLLLILSITIVLSTAYSHSIKAYAQYDNNNPFFIDNSIPNYNYVRGVVLPQLFGATPISIWDLFIQEGIKIYITESSPKFASNNGATAGITYDALVYYDSSSQKVLSVNAPIEIYVDSNNINSDAYFHECGHALDFVADYITGYYKGDHTISSSPKWISLYDKYALIMACFDDFASVNMYDNEEAFAEAYRLYLRYPQALQLFCPEVYTFVSDQIKKYTAYVPPVTYDSFDYVSYANEYPDLIQVFGLDKKALWNHFVSYGKAEGRTEFKYVTPKR